MQHRLCSAKMAGAGGGGGGNGGGGYLSSWIRFGYLGANEQWQL